MKLASKQYSSNVRINNWYEDKSFANERIRAYKVLQEKGVLMVDKIRLLVDRFEEKVALEAPKPEVRFDTTIQLVSPYMHICNNPTPDVPLGLSLNILDEKCVYSTQNICDRCDVTIASLKGAHRRNCFKVIKIINPDADDRPKNDVGQLLHYGENFRLKVARTAADPLYLYCPPKPHSLVGPVPPVSSYKLGEENLPLQLVYLRNCGPGTETPYKYLDFYMQHPIPGRRFETIGEPVPNNVPVVITSAVRNKNIAAEPIRVSTVFGSEYLASLQNYKNVQKKEEWNNIWLVNNGAVEL